MNTIYKLVWNPNLKAMVVASEFAKGKTKGATGAASGKLRILTVLSVTVASVFMSAGLAAATIATPIQAQDGTYSTGAASATGGDSVAAGAGSKASAQGTTAVGASAEASALNATAIGILSEASGQQSLALGWQATSSGLYSTAIGPNATAAASQSIALGLAATTAAGANNAIAFGRAANAGAVDAMALGFLANASAVNSVALGAGSATTANLTLAGYNPGTTALSGVASTANGEVSMGAGSKERRVTNIAAGAAATDAVNVSQLRSEAEKSDNLGASTAIALGGGAVYNADGTISAPTYSVGGATVHTVGDAITNLDGRTTQNTTSITNLQGDLAGATRYFKANGDNDGTDDAVATGTDAVAIGADAQASANFGTAVGRGAKSVGTGSGTALGNSASTINGGVAVGTGAGASAPSTYRSVYVGEQAGSGAQTSSNVAVGYSAGQNVTGSAGFNTAIGSMNTGSNMQGDYNTSVGHTAGYSTKGSYNNSMGVNAGQQSTGDYNVSIGSGAGKFVSGSRNVALGSGTNTGTALSNLLAVDDAVAIGTLATAGTDGAVAIGAEAAVTAAGSVALGTGALADRADTVSVGAAGSERQIVNVAAGTADTDVVNISQLKGVVDGLGAGATVNPDGTITGPSYTVTNLDGSTTTVNNVGDAITNIDSRVVDNTTNITQLTTQINNGGLGLVKQDAGTLAISVATATGGTTVDFTGTDGARSLAGVKAGALAADSLEAVNGSQLFETNNNVTDLAGRVDVVEGDITNIQGDIVNLDERVTISEGDISSLDNRVTVNEGDITNIQGDITTINTSIGDIDNRVTNVEGDITQLTTQINNGEVGLVKQDAGTLAISVAAATGGTAVDFTGTDGARSLAGVKAGALAADSLEAVNGSQLFETNNNVTDLADRVDVVEGDIANIQGDITTINTNIGEIDNRVTNVEGDISNLTTQINSAGLGLVKQDADTLAITVAAATGGASVDFTGTEGARTLAGVKAGALVADSLEAVNGSQLFETNNNVTDLAGRVDVVEGDITDIQGDITNLDNRVTVNEGDIANIQGDITTINTNIGEIDSRVTNVEGDISNLTTQINNGEVGLVKQDAGTLAITVAAATGGTSVSIAGTEGARTLAGVKAGALAADSLEAVNGSQLFETNNNVTDLAGRVDVVEGDITDIQGDITNLDSRVTVNEGDISNLDNRVTVNEGDIANIQGDITTINANIGEIDNRVTNVEGDISNLTTQINNGEVGLVKQDAGTLAITVAAATGGTSVSIAGTEGERTLAGVKAGAQDADAVNVSQLKGALAGLGGGATVNPDGSITGPSYMMTNIDGTTTTVTNVGDAITNIDNRVVDNTTNISNLATQINNGEVGLVQQDEDTREITVAKDKDGTTVNFTGTAGARVLEGVAAGAVTASSLQAVNGSQLYGVSQSVATHLGGGSVVNADGTVSAPSYSVGGTTVNNVGDAVANLDERTTQNSNEIAELKSGIGDISGSVTEINNTVTTINNNVGDLDNRVTNLEQTITNGGFGDSGLVSATVGEGGKQLAAASGADSLAVGNAAVASGDTSTALGNNSQANAANSVALGNGSIADRDGSVSVGAKGNERQVTNVAAGTEDTDAVNMAQLKQSVRYDQKEDGSIDYSRVTLGQQGTPVTMTNVARGRVAADSSDAINGAQMYDWTMNHANQFSNVSLGRQINEVERAMHAGVATALAARQAPYVPGHVTYSVGAAGYKSQGAVGVSSRYTADSGRWSLEGGFSHNGDGTGVYVGMSGVLGD